jgi:hypothetical protein
MKKKLLLLTVIGVMSVSLAAMAASPVVKVRVLDVTAYGENKLNDDAGVVKAATISTAENPQLYPVIESLVFTVGKSSVDYAPDASVPAGSLNFSGSIGETEPFEFISISNPDEVGKYDVAVVGRDGKVTYLDDPVVIDYRLRTIATPAAISVKDGDTLLIFVKTADPISPDKRETALDHYQHEQPHEPLNPTHGQDHGGGGPGGNGGAGQ